jgi:hypothetical protein
MAFISIQGNAKFLGNTKVNIRSNPTYSIGRSLSSVNEGSSVTFTLSTTNVANGTLVPYTISGISANDVTTGSLTGNFTVLNNLATATITMSADQITEGSETLTLTLNNAVTSNFVVVNDTSLFTPTTISGLQLWLDASDGSTLYNATVGGSLVTTDGAAVARWADKSGNNRHATQSTSNARPILKTNIKNGRNVLRFDGSNDWLSINSIASFFNSSHTIFAVAQTDAFSAAGYQVIVGARGYHHILGFANDSINSYMVVVSDMWNSTDVSYVNRVRSYTKNNWVVSTRIVDATSTPTIQLAVNNNTSQAGALPAGSTLGGKTQADIGAIQNSWYLNGQISEILVYNYVLTTTQRAQVQSYLNSKWALY